MRASIAQDGAAGKDRPSTGVIAMRPFSALFAATVALAGSACVAAAGDESADTQLQRMVGDAGCSADHQCRSIAWGAKACGGPERYVAWSTLRTDPQALQDLAARHAAARREENVRNGTLSTCSFLADPGAACVAGRCQLGHGAGPAAR
jgi:hypothetical protein